MKNLISVSRLSGIILSSSGLSIAFCFFLLSFRVVYTGSISFAFLAWNLVLAVFPYIFIKLLPEAKKLKTQLLLLFLSILFLPNAPYILTDLFHLRLNAASTIWYDTLLIVSFAWCGMLFFFKSLNGIEQWLQARLAQRYALLALFTIILLCGFGIYLGRYLRFNSWDILTAPGALASEIIDRLLHPHHHPRTWGLTLGYGLFFMLTYLTVGRKTGVGRN